MTEEEMNELLGVEPEGPPSPELLELRRRIADHKQRLVKDPMSFFEPGGQLIPVTSTTLSFSGNDGKWNCWACAHVNGATVHADFLLVEESEGHGRTGLCSDHAAQFTARYQ